MSMRLLMFFALLFTANTSSGQQVKVEIIDRADKQSSYSYVVPGYTTQTTTGNAACNGYGNSVNCNGSTSTFATTSPGISGTYQVTGATLTLKLPDNRLVVVNCNAKVNWTEWTEGAFRSCRVPLVKHIEAEFKGDKAKLRWVVSIDGKKTQSETYKILGIIEPSSN